MRNWRWREEVPKGVRFLSFCSFLGLGVEPGELLRAGDVDEADEVTFLPCQREFERLVIALRERASGDLGGVRSWYGLGLLERGCARGGVSFEHQFWKGLRKPRRVDDGCRRRLRCRRGAMERKEGCNYHHSNTRSAKRTTEPRAVER